MSEKYRGNPEEQKESSVEEWREYIPSREEVKGIFERLVEGVSYETRREEKDEDGIYLWEITLSEKDADGNSVEYMFMRSSRYKDGVKNPYIINIVFFDETGFPVDGNSVAKYNKGDWKIAL